MKKIKNFLKILGLKNEYSKSFAKMRRAAFGNASGFNVNVSGLVRRSVKSGKSSDRFVAMEASGMHRMSSISYKILHSTSWCSFGRSRPCKAKPGAEW